MTIRAIVFDMDGVLVDSEPLWHTAEIELFGAVGVPLTVADCLQTTGLRIDEVVRRRHAERPWTTPSCDDLARSIVARVVALVGARGTPMAGAVEAVRFARARVDQLALASSSPRALIDAVLARLGVRDAFDVVHSAEGEAHGKPAPDVYLTTARMLGVDPAACAAIEDSANGLRAALAAGMRAIAVPDPHGAVVDPAVLARAHVVLTSLRELPARIDDVLGA